MAVSAEPHRKDGVCAGHGACSPVDGTCACDALPLMVGSWKRGKDVEHRGVRSTPASVSEYAHRIM